LFAVCPNVAELLAVMALCKAILSFICLYPDCDAAECWQSENLLGFCSVEQGDETDEEWGRFLVVVPWDSDRRVFNICLTLIMTKSKLISPPDMSSMGVLSGRWRITALMGFKDFG
jgi:hypothetical protein